MSHTYIANYVHCVFGTRERQNLVPVELQPKLCAYLIGIAKNLGVTLIAAGGTSNHVHLLLALPPTMPIAEAVQKLKANSSRWLREQGLDFKWQEGYGAFSVSPSLVDKVQAYVRNQEEHHRKRDFEEEFVALLGKSGITFDTNRLFT